MEKKGIGTGAKNKKEKKMKDKSKRWRQRWGWYVECAARIPRWFFFRNRNFWYVCGGNRLPSGEGIPFCEKKKIASSTGSVEGQKL